MIEICNITKKYSRHIALDNVSFTIKKNAVVGLLGQNGAGKTTLMDIMAGCNKADSGKIFIHNTLITDKPGEYKNYIAYVPEHPPLYSDMTVLEYINFVAELKAVLKADRKAHIQEILTLTGLEKVAKRLIRNLSKGYKQRIGIAQALIGNAEILIFDEPTVGLDPKQIHDILELIKKLSHNKTIIISSHRLYEIQEICNEYIILHKGVLKHSGQINPTQQGNCIIELLIDNKDISIIDKISPIQFVNKVRKSNVSFINGLELRTLLIDCSGDCFPEKTLNVLLHSNDITIYGLRRIKEDIEHIFLELTKE